MLKFALPRAPGTAPATCAACSAVWTSDGRFEWSWSHIALSTARYGGFHQCRDRDRDRNRDGEEYVREHKTLLWVLLDCLTEFAVEFVKALPFLVAGCATCSNTKHWSATSSLLYRWQEGGSYFAYCNMAIICTTKGTYMSIQPWVRNLPKSIRVLYSSTYTCTSRVHTGMSILQYCNTQYSTSSTCTYSSVATVSVETTGQYGHIEIACHWVQAWHNDDDYWYVIASR